MTSVHVWDDTRIYHKQIQFLKTLKPVIYYAPSLPGEEACEGVELRHLYKWNRDKKSDRLKNLWPIFRIFHRHRRDIIHFHDPEILPFALLGKFLFGGTVIMDVHENNENDIRDKDWLPGPVAHLAANIYRWFFGLAAKHLDGLVLAVEHFIDSVPEKYRHKAVTIHNYPRLELFSHVAEKAAGYEQDETIRLGYVGVVRDERGLTLMCRLVETLDRMGRKTVLELVGNIPPGEPEHVIAETNAVLSPGSRINAYGLTPYDEAMAVMSRIDIGLALFKPLFNYINSNPVKLFEFMILRKPVITSNFPILDDIVLRYGSGLTVDAEDLNAVTEAVLKIKDGEDSVRTMGEKGYKAVMDRFNWHVEEEILAGLYRKFLN